MCFLNVLENFKKRIKEYFTLACVNGYAGLFQLNNAGDAKQSYLHNTPKRTSVIEGHYVEDRAVEGVSHVRGS